MPTHLAAIPGRARRLAASIALVSGVLGVSTAAAQPRTLSTGDLYKQACAACHGLDGSGRAPTQAIRTRPRDLTNCRIVTPERDADWRIVIARGGPSAGLSSEMPSYGETLTAEQIDALIAWLRTFCREPGWPSGNANLSRPLVTAKAFPDDELVIAPQATHRPGDRWQYGVAAAYSARLGRRGAAEVTIPVETVYWVRGLVSGFGDVALAAKYVLHADPPGTRIVTGGVEVRFPTGDRTYRFGEGTTRFEPFVAAARAAGAVSVQAELRLELPAKYRTIEEDERNRHVLYNAYVGVDRSPDLATWTLGIEINGLDKRLSITPQVRKGLTRTGAFAAAAGARLPIVDRALPQAKQVMGYLIWSYREPVRARR